MTIHTAPRSQTVLLTGATGYIGSAVLDALLAAGHTVAAITRSDTASAAVEAAGATALPGDIRDVEWLIAQPREYDVLAPVYDLIQTLHAVYAKACIETIRQRGVEVRLV